MTDEPIIEEVPAQAGADTAFMIIKDWDGSWRATTKFEDVSTISREANRSDIKLGCKEMFDFLSEDDLASLIVFKLLTSNSSDSQRATDAIRHALQDRDIL